MRDRPDGAELLAIAAAMEAAPPAASPEAQRYRSLMIANARAIAARDGTAAEAAERAEYARLARIMGEPDHVPADAAAMRAKLAGLTRCLIAGIREGRFDPGTPERPAVYAHLKRATTARVAISNPKALPKEGED